MAHCFVTILLLFLMGGSHRAKLAVKTDINCHKLMPKAGATVTDQYVNCLYTLEQLVTALIKDHEINIKKCKPDSKNPSIAYCPVWVWFLPKHVLLTNPDYIDVMAGRKTLEQATEIKLDAEARKESLKDLAEKQAGEISNAINTSGQSTGSDDSGIKEPKLKRRTISRSENPAGEPQTGDGSGTERREIRRVEADDTTY